MDSTNIAPRSCKCISGDPRDIHTAGLAIIRINLHRKMSRWSQATGCVPALRCRTLREAEQHVDEEMRPHGYLRKFAMRMSSMILLAALTTPFVTTPTAAAWVHRYKTEEATKKHCPNDEIVWGSSRGTYYPKESRLYGKSRGGAYACAREAYAGGWRQDSE